MAVIYLVHIVQKILICSKYTLNVTIIWRPFILIIIFEYTCNNIVHMHSKYTFVNPNIFKYVLYNTQNTPLYTHRAMITLVTFAANAT